MCPLCCFWKADYPSQNFYIWVMSIFTLTFISVLIVNLICDRQCSVRIVSLIINCIRQHKTQWAKLRVLDIYQHLSNLLTDLLTPSTSRVIWSKGILFVQLLFGVDRDKGQCKCMCALKRVTGHRQPFPVPSWFYVCLQNRVPSYTKVG